MQVSQIVSRDVETIDPAATVREAAQRMRSMDVGSLPVCDGSHLLGMITDRDITIRAIADGRDPAQTPVRDAMTPSVEYVFEDDDVQRAAQIMQDMQIRRLPVVNREKKLVGIIALGDIARTGDDRMSGNTLQDISDPERQPSEARDDRA
jgi:CBS domain-containing protein